MMSTLEKVRLLWMVDGLDVGVDVGVVDGWVVPPSSLSPAAVWWELPKH